MKENYCICICVSRLDENKKHKDCRKMFMYVDDINEEIIRENINTMLNSISFPKDILDIAIKSAQYNNGIMVRND